MNIFKLFIFTLLAGSAIESAALSLEHNTCRANVPLECVISSGELKERILRNFDRMETEYYQPAQVFWSEEESGGWPGDKEGRTILALIMDQRSSGRRSKYLEQLIEELPTRLNAMGFLGTIHDNIDEQQLSGHGWLLRGLCEYFEMSRDSAVLEIASNIVDNLFIPTINRISLYPLLPSDRIKETGDMSGSVQNEVNGWRLSSDIGCIFIGMEGLIHYYKHRQEENVKDLIEEMISLFLKMDLVELQAQTHASLTALRGIMRYMEITGDYSLLPEVEERWKLYTDFGMTANYENYNWFGRYDTWTEPCAIMDSYILAVQLWQASGNTKYLDVAEKIYYNGICHTQRENGGFGCDKPVGKQFDDISIHADEAYWCCTMRGAEGLARVSQYSYFSAGDTIYVPFFRDNLLNLNEKGLKIEQHTNYPFNDDVTFKILNSSVHNNLILALHILEYMDNFSVETNNISVPYQYKDGFIFIDSKDLGNGELKLTYSFSNKIIPGDGDKFKIEFGPLVLSSEENENLKDLRPLYHLMSPQVCIQDNYKRKVLFTND